MEGMVKSYLKEVILLLRTDFDTEAFGKRLQKQNISLQIMKAGYLSPEELFQGKDTPLLVLSDDERICKWMLENQFPVIGLEHNRSDIENVSEGRGEILWKLPYVIQDLHDIDVMYLERIYRRFKGIPWDILETDRCLLREVTVEDVERIAEIYQAPSVKKYMEPLYEPLEREVAYVEDYIKKIYGFYGYGTWIIIEKSSGKIIGRAGIENYGNQSREEGGTQEMESDNPIETENGIELGYLIEDAYQGQGYGYEVCSAILEYARENLEIPVIWTRIQKENEASIALCKKLGFVEKMQENTRYEQDMHLFRYGGN